MAGYIRRPFFHAEMADVLAAADVVLSRAGASALWEGAALGKPLVLLPLGTAGSRGDQLENARCFADHGAAIVLKRGSGEELRRALDTLADPEARQRLGDAARQLCGDVRPAVKIAEEMWVHLAKKVTEATGVTEVTDVTVGTGE
jgi:UDP-N-acetylglucosamine--N-acetylmuramyl-(pentapeptide) pyrophosphoryl-undecaprenol N-acetylglucosamine transferase